MKGAVQKLDNSTFQHFSGNENFFLKIGYLPMLKPMLKIIFKIQL